MKAPRKLVQLFELGRLVDELFETIARETEKTRGDEYPNVPPERERAVRELEAMEQAILDGCTLSDDTKLVIAAVESLELDTEQTTQTFNRVAVRFAAFKRRQEGNR